MSMNQDFGESSFDHYLKQIASYELLTREDEVELFNRINQGDQIALDRMVRANLRLVLKIAFKYKQRGLMIHDLVEEGNVGLLEAVKRFDITKGFRFSTYATWWIRQNIEKAIMEQTRTIRLPTHVIRELSKILRVSDKLIQEHFNTKVSLDDLSKKIGVPKERIEEVIRHRYDVMSLDQLLYEDSRTTLAMVVRDMDDNIEKVEQDNMIDRLREGLDQLPRVERRIIKLRFGLDGRRPRPIVKIAEQLNVSRDYVIKSIKKSQAQIAAHFDVGVDDADYSGNNQDSA